MAHAKLTLPPELSAAGLPAQAAAFGTEPPGGAVVQTGAIKAPRRRRRGPQWPALREELALYHGPADRHGQPSWTLHDPVRHRFLRIDWLTWEILRHWWLADPALIVQEIEQTTTLQLTPEDVAEVLAMAVREELVIPTALPTSKAGQEHPGLQGTLTWLLHNYLFFRIPLFRPDAWLTAMLPWLRGLGSTAFTRLTLVLAVVAAYGLLQQSAALQAQWVDLLSWRGLMLYGLTLIGVKVAHELGHALVAKHHGCRVPTMGVAFMVLWPVAYTDTTEAWRLSDAKARRHIAAAGVRTELTLAVWASLAWCVLPESPLRTAMFVMATMTWVSSVLINLSPFMRFDGYFLLCDTLDMPNLHERSFAAARWWLRRMLLGWQAPPPEDLRGRPLAALIGFGLATWLARLMLYLGIAWTVYHFGFKVLGLLLFAVEMGWFIVMPIARETGVWWEHRALWRSSRRVKLSLAVVGVLIALGFVPWPATVSGGAMVVPAQTLHVRLPSAVHVDTVHVKLGQAVSPGQALLTTSAPSLNLPLHAAQARIAQLEQEVQQAAMGGEQQARWHALQAALQTAREQAQAAQTESDRYQPKAPFAGTVVDLHPGLRAGAMSPVAREPVLVLASNAQWRVVAYVDEQTAQHLQTGDAARVGLDADPVRRFDATIRSVAPQPSAVLPEAALAQLHGGLVNAKDTPQGLIPVDALYRVELTLTPESTQALNQLAPRSWRGHVVLRGPAESVWLKAWRVLGSALVRESGF